MFKKRNFNKKKILKSYFFVVVIFSLETEQQLEQLLRDMGINKKLIIDYTELEFGKKIGEGSYGQVFKGEWQRTDVAIKVPNCLKISFPDKIVWFYVICFYFTAIR